MSFIAVKSDSVKEIMTMLSSFSITMTGFVAAIGAYIISISHKVSFVKWKVNGYIRPFYHLYGMCIVFLLLTFVLCVANSMISIGFVMLKLTLSVFIVNLIHIALLTLVVIGQSRSAEDIN